MANHQEVLCQENRRKIRKRAMSYTGKGIVHNLNKRIFFKNLLAIGFGFLFALAIFGAFAIVLMFFPNQLNAAIVDIIIFSVISFTGAFLTASAALHSKLVCSFITIILLLLFFGSLFDFNLDNNSSRTIILVTTSVVSGFAGGLIAISKKII